MRFGYGIHCIFLHSGILLEQLFSKCNTLVCETLIACIADYFKTAQKKFKNVTFENEENLLSNFTIL